MPHWKLFWNEMIRKQRTWEDKKRRSIMVGRWGWGGATASGGGAIRINVSRHQRMGRRRRIGEKERCFGSEEMGLWEWRKKREEGKVVELLELGERRFGI